MQRQTGFTLVEILFVLVIIAAVMAYALPSYKRTQARAAYDAATGVLVDLGSALQNIKQDLMMQGYSFTQYPLPASSYQLQITGTETANGTDTKEKTLKEFVAISNAATRDTRFAGSLFSFGYMEPFVTEGYKYYAIRGTSATACSNKCRDTGTVACMCKDSLDNSDCYYGAVFLSTGKVKKLEGNNCRS